MEIVDIEIKDLKPHPRNYRSHPKEQIEHLKESIQKNGIYRNVVVSQDGFLLAGHGVVQAAIELGIEKIPVSKIPIDHDHPNALKIIVADNEVSQLSEDDNRVLCDLLKRVKEEAENGLLGTGYDAQALQALVLASRGKDEIEGAEDAADWVGMPEYEPKVTNRVVVTFGSEEDRAKFAKLIGIEIGESKDGKKSVRWPATGTKDGQGKRKDLKSILFVSSERADGLDGSGDV